MRRFWQWVVLGLAVVEGMRGKKFPTYPKITNRTFINQYLDAHNNYRCGVQPTASNMLYMTFDLALARIARAWGQKCIFAHNPNTKVHPEPKFRPCGENIWKGSASSQPFNVAGPISAFYNEVKYYTLSTHQCTKVCGHYTQVVWSASYKVGCAVVFCSRMKDGGRNVLLLVCNYAPAGNYVGVRPYKQGESCSECPKGDTCQKQLCRNPEREKENSKRYSRWYPPFEFRIICDGSCIAVAILRPLFMFLAFATVYYLQLRYPGLSIKK
ncbi:GLIPR1-like protein 1 [Rhineura floridana]|uniref:GLIPR1-like protein 1 n=1 Tax=Rhineura floridana TaxID=261503 RepID=UPI002AC875A1|nr:GLIPR1-like protein 1 [Rhineura floridana]